MGAVDKQKITRLQIIKYAKIKFLQRSADNRIAKPINFGAQYVVECDCGAVRSVVGIEGGVVSGC